MLALTTDLQTGLEASPTREGMAVARRSHGQPQGRGPKIKPTQEHQIARRYRADYDTVREVGALFNVSRSTVRSGEQASSSARVPVTRGRTLPAHGILIPCADEISGFEAWESWLSIDGPYGSPSESSLLGDSPSWSISKSRIPIRTCRFQSSRYHM